MIKYCIPEIRKSRGSIVNMSSLSGLLGQKQNPVYSATKGAIIAMTKALPWIMRRMAYELIAFVQQG